MTQRHITTVFNGPMVAEFVRTRKVNHDLVCSDYSEHNPGVSSPAGTSQGTGKLGQLFLRRLASFFSRRRDEPIDYSEFM